LLGLSLSVSILVSANTETLASSFSRAVRLTAIVVNRVNMAGAWMAMLSMQVQSSKEHAGVLGWSKALHCGVVQGLRGANYWGCPVRFPPLSRVPCLAHRRAGIQAFETRLRGSRRRRYRWIHEYGSDVEYRHCFVEICVAEVVLKLRTNSRPEIVEVLRRVAGGRVLIS
jgi:hypothetical protein